MGMLLGNPLIYRFSRSLTRPGLRWAAVMALIGILLLGYAYCYADEYFENHDRDRIDYQKVFHGFSAIVMFLEITLASYVTLGLALDTVASERLGNTYEFLVTLPISPARKVLGLWIGSGLWALMGLTVLAPVAVLTGLAGGLNVGRLLWFQAICLSCWGAAGLVGVALSSSLGKARWVLWIVLGLLILGLFPVGAPSSRSFAVVPVLTISPYGLLHASAGEMDDLARIFQPGQYHFYGLAVPWQVCPVVFFVFLSIVAYVVGLRRHERPSGRAAPRLGLVVAYVAFQFLLTGFLSDAFAKVSTAHDWASIAWAYLYLGFFFILIWAMVATPNYAGLMEWVQQPGRVLLGRAFGDLKSLSLLPSTLFWIVTVITVLGIDLFFETALKPLSVLSVCAVMLLFLWAYQALFLVGCQSWRKWGKEAGLILVVVVIMVPVAFASISELQRWLCAGPIGMGAVDESILVESPRHVWRSGGAVRLSAICAAAQLVVFVVLMAWRLRALRAIAPRTRTSAAGAPPG